MRRMRSCAGLGLMLAGAVLLSGCNNGKGATVDVIAIGDPATPFESGGRLPPAAQLLRGAVGQGMVALDEQAQVVPGLADRWIVTDDGLSYIFRLRDAEWSEGGKLSAAAVRTALLQSLAALRGTALFKDLSSISEVRVMTGRVVEIRLSRPQPELLLLLAQPELGLLYRGKGAGPLALRRDGKVAYLSMIDPVERGLPAADDWQEQVRPLRFRALPADAAIARFDRGEADAVLGGKLEHFPLANAGALSRGAIRLDPVVGLLGLAVVHSDGFLADPAHREAIAMAIDRQSLPATLGIGGWAMTERLLPALVEDGPEPPPERWAGQSLEERQALAAARVARWRGGKGDPVTLRIAMPAGPGSDRLLARLSTDLAKAGLTAVRVDPSAPADLRLIDVVARYPGANWFFHQLSCGVLPGPCSAEADKLADEALWAASRDDRLALLAKAESRLTDSDVFIPLGAPIRWSLLRGNASGFAPNRLGYHPLMPMALRPK